MGYTNYWREGYYTAENEKVYIEAYMTDVEIDRRVAQITERVKQIAEWSGGPMSPKLITSWARVAADAGAVSVDATGIYAAKTAGELRDQVLYEEFYSRKYTLKDMPEDLSDPVAAAKEYHADWMEQ